MLAIYQNVYQDGGWIENVPQNIGQDTKMLASSSITIGSIM